MGCNTNECKSEEQSCQQKKGCCSSGCQMTDNILRMTEEAWNQAVIGKMKELFEQEMGEKIDKIAAAGVKASMTYWSNKMKGKTEMHNEFDNIKKSMMG